MTALVHPDPEVMATLLRGNPDYRVLRRFAPREHYTATPSPAYLRKGVYVDVETTGLEEDARIIQLALVRFGFDAFGAVYDVGPATEQLQDPGIPLPDHITELTGITDDDVRGQAIDEDLVATLLDGVGLVIAHNAAFDRPRVEARLPRFAALPWACSYGEVEWERFGCVGKKLPHILQGTCSEFYNAHRALDDCLVGVHVLASAQLEGRSALSYLLESARQPTLRVWAVDSPFELKEALKQRGYRWHDGTTGRSKCWYRDCTPAECEVELAWLRERRVYAVGTRFTAVDRYSARVG